VGLSKCSPRLARTVPRVLDERIVSSATQELPRERVETEPAPSPEAPVYHWLQNWWPISPVSYLDTTRPNHHCLAGRDLVVWRDGAGAWSVMSDACPHRLAPLSQGRLVGGRLVCSYHGWAFNAQGGCTAIPQMPQPGANAGALAKACGVSYPVRQVDGVLWVWLDNSPEGVAKSALSEPYVAPEASGSAFEWVMNEVPNDFPCGIEQGMDPTHANFLHVGIGMFKSENVIPMPPTTIPLVDPHTGFVWFHSGYEKKNEGMRAIREFKPPFYVRARYTQERGGKTSTISLNTMTVPVRPGWMRTWFKLAFAPNPREEEYGGGGVPTSSASTPARTHEPAALTATSSAHSSGADAGHNGSSSQGAAAAAATTTALATTSHTTQALVPTTSDEQPKEKPKQGGGAAAGIFKLLGKLPHWVSLNMELLDQDTVMMHIQGRLMARQGLTPRDYRLLAPGADAGVAGVNRWLRQAGYPASLWGALPASSPHAAAAATSNGGTNGAGSAAASGSAGAFLAGEQLPLERLLDTRERHVKHCAVCREGLVLVTNACYAATAVAALAAAYTLCLAAVAQVVKGSVAAGGAPLAWAAVGAVVLGLAAYKLWGFRTARFISGLPAWRRKGGLSLIPASIKAM